MRCQAQAALHAGTVVTCIISLENIAYSVHTGLEAKLKLLRSTHCRGWSQDNFPFRACQSSHADQVVVVLRTE